MLSVPGGGGLNGGNRVIGENTRHPKNHSCLRPLSPLVEGGSQPEPAEVQPRIYIDSIEPFAKVFF